MSIRPKVSVIIPVYNAAEFIERCARSLFEQTLDSIEYIFVNDCTPDNSFDILVDIMKDYPHRKEQVKIISMPVNSRQAAARTAGMKKATGEYIIHFDPDDWVEKDAYKKLYDAAVFNDADIVTCKFNIHKNGSILVSGYDFQGPASECLLQLQFDSPLCNKLIRREIIAENSLYPYEGINCGEDLNVTVRALYFAKKVVSVNLPLYNYNQDNTSSITHGNSLKLIEKYGIENFRRLEEFAVHQNNPELMRILDFLKIREKRPLLWPWYGREYRDIYAWCKLWPESHKSLKHFPEFSKSEKIIYPLIAGSPFLMKIYFKYLHLRNAD